MAMIEEKRAVFYDNLGDTHVVLVTINPGVFLGIESYNDMGEKTGYINFCFHPHNRIFLESVYCFDNCRSKGVASRISELTDFVLREYVGYIIRGVYLPSQLSIDRECEIYRSPQELDLRATKFYQKNGYEIISLEDYLNNPVLYPNLLKDYDFQLGEELVEVIVTKKIKALEKYQYKEIGGIYVHDNVINSFDSIPKSKILGRYGS